MVGRLAPGIGLASAQDRMKIVAGRLEREYPDSQRGIGYDLRPATGFEDSLRGGAVGFFAIMGALAGLVLAVAGVNVAGVLLARAFAREKEIGLRLALGARRSRIVRLLLVETLVLFAAGGACGALLATPTARLLAGFRLPFAVPIVLDLSPNPRSAAFALLAAAVGGVIFGLAAALPATRGTDTSLLRSGAATERRSAARLRSAFVSLQLAGSVLLLVTAGLFLRTVRHAATVNPGFDPEGMSMTSVDLSMLGYDAARARAFFDRLQAQAKQWPGVEAVTITGVVPLGLNSRETSVHMPGADAPADAVPVDFTDVGESYFSAMRIPILQGRAFGTTDAPDAPATAIVNETLAKKLWPGREPIGQVLVEGGRPRTVVGVARDGKYRRPWEAPRSYLYLPFRQQGRLRENLIVRSRGSAESVAGLLRAQLIQLEPALPPGAVFPVREHLALSVLPQRLAAQVAAGLGALGLALSAIGLAGLVAYSVSRRTREIGVRMALGAAPADVLRLEMGRGVRVAAGGLALGMAAALLSTSLTRDYLFGVDAADPATFGGVLLLLLCVALAACYFPARRAARVSPSEALRSY